MIITGVNGIRIPCADFDGVAVETANFTDARPQNWDGTSPTARFRFQAAAGGTGAVVWEIAIAAVNEGDDPDIVPSYTAVTDAIVTAERDQLTPATAPVPISGTLTADSRLQFWIRRNPAAAGDTMTGADARLLSVDLLFALA